MAVNIVGIVSIAVFYLIILGIGIWAGWRKRKVGIGQESETIMVARRDIGLIIGCFTMTATWVGGLHIIATAESIYSSSYGFIWTQAPFAYALSLVVGGIFTAKKMRQEGYSTLLDPVQNKLGRIMGGLLFLPHVLGEMLWGAGILGALGITLSVIVGIDVTAAIIASAAIAILYTIIGGLYSVAYTDIVQLLCLVIGIIISVPFAMNNSAAGNISETAYSGEGGWYGVLSNDRIGEWIDYGLVMMLGGVPSQEYHQRVLAASTPGHAQIISFMGGLGTVLTAIPSILIGAVATSTNWTETTYKNGSSPAVFGEERKIFPLVLLHMTPTAVSFIGLGAVAAAVMSSADSIMLSSSSQFTRNIYNEMLRPKASEKELVWVLRVSVVISGAVTTTLALSVKSLYMFTVLPSDLLYILLFPQFLCVLFFDPNTYGSLCGCIIGIILRIGGGEPTIGLDPYIHYPGGRNFPFRTFSMIICLVATLVVSCLLKYLFERKIIPSKYDFFQCNLANGGISHKTPSDNKKREKRDVELNTIDGIENPVCCEESEGTIKGQRRI